ncbi:hypothetical protein HZA98_03235 [Candidatus Woesearchaeota archaeon]|nr:hypothetical protein [Candidatus Woesearchaeota archaeon]
MNKEEMLLIIHDTILNFRRKIKEPYVTFLEKKRFSHYLDLMELEKHLNKTPCFVSETKGGAVIYYCEDIINKLSKDLSKEKKKEFIEAVTLHELLHLWNGIRAKNDEQAIFSEELAQEEFKKFYPKHSQILEEVKQRNNKKLYKSLRN